MEALEYSMKVWTLNQMYDQIKNCKVVKPHYETGWNYWEKFFMDKREWLISFFSDPARTFYDKVTIKNIDYYLYKEGTKMYLWADTWATILALMTGKTIDADSPIKLVTGRTAYWPTLWTGIAITNPTAGIWDANFDGPLAWYSWGYVKFQTNPLPALWDYITFTSWALVWATNKVELIDAWYVHIIWTNARWTVPSNWDTISVFDKTGVGILIGHTTGVTLYILDGINPPQAIDVLATDKPIKDLIKHDGNLFALTEDRVYFTRNTFDDNTQFYKLDAYPVDWGYKLFSLWKALLAFWKTNKLFAAANTTNVSLWYVWYDVNYNWNLFSKYSCIFADQTIYIVQDDLQLMQVSVINSNSTTFDLVVKNILWSIRWLFENIETWEIFIASNDRFLNFLHIDNWDTTNYQYDKQMSHWLINEYVWKEIYLMTDKILAKGDVYTVWGLDDDWVEYEQEVNFSLQWGQVMYMPYIIRTIFWIKDLDTPIDLVLDIEFEIWGKIETKTKLLWNYVFDNRLSETLTWDELIWSDTVPKEQVTYNWNVVSLQSGIYKTWRYIRFRYHSFNRFIIGETFIFTEKTKPMINEILLTN